MRAAGKPEEATAPTLHDGFGKLRAWRDEGRPVHAYFFRNVLTGAAAAASVRGRITRLDEAGIEVAFDAGALTATLSGAECFDGPLVLVDAASGTSRQRDAVQIKLSGGDSLLISTIPVDGADRLLTSRFRLPDHRK